MNKRLTRISKFLTFVLRHQPESIGLQRDSDGWVDVHQLVTNANEHGKSLSLAQIHDVIAASEVKRFAIHEDGQRIRVI
jgi:putative RNA 2'-phosphotransferase